MSEQSLSPNNPPEHRFPHARETQTYEKVLFSAFTDKYGESGSFNKKIGTMFSLSPEAQESLTADEVVDVKNFGRHATKRLAVAAIVSPINRERVWRGGLYDLNDAFHETSPEGLVHHDVIHAMEAWRRTKGRSLIPTYAKVETKDEQASNETALREELVVSLFDNNTLLNDIFNDSILEGDNFRKQYERFRSGASSSIVLEKKTEYSHYMQGVESKKKINPLEYYLCAYENFLRTLVENPDFQTTLETVQANRDPEYVDIFRRTYENWQLEQPDLKFTLHEFQRILAPLLVRLRKGENKVAVST